MSNLIDNRAALKLCPNINIKKNNQLIQILGVHNE